MEERQGEREIKIEFLLWLHDMEKPAPKPVPKAGPLFCIGTKDLASGLDRNLGAWPCLFKGDSGIAGSAHQQEGCVIFFTFLFALNLSST